MKAKLLLLLALAALALPGCHAAEERFFGNLPEVETLADADGIVIWKKSGTNTWRQQRYTIGELELALPFEPALGNPGTNGYVLSSTTAGVRSWIAAGSGSGTVTTLSITSANGVSGTVANATTTPAITLSLGAITPTTVNGLTITTSTGTLTIANGKMLTASNTLALAGTDGSTLNIGTGGTLGAAAFLATSANVQTLLGAANYAAFKTSLSLDAVENTALSTWEGSTSLQTLGNVTAGEWLAGPVGITYGGTGATSASAARTALGLAIGTHVQAYHINLANISVLANGAGWLRNNGSGAFSYTTPGVSDIESASSANVIVATEIDTLSELDALAQLPVEMCVAMSDETTDLTTGTAKVTFRAPYAFTITAVRASVNTVSSSGTVTVDINEGGTTILSTKLTIDASEKTSTTAAAAAVISDAAIADDAEITMDIDVAGTGAKGLKVLVLGHR